MHVVSGQMWWWFVGAIGAADAKQAHGKEGDGADEHDGEE